jgi:hypothetical protein
MIIAYALVNCKQLLWDNMVPMWLRADGFTLPSMNGSSFPQGGLNCFGNDHDEEEWIKLVFQYML